MYANDEPTAVPNVISIYIRMCWWTPRGRHHARTSGSPYMGHRRDVGTNKTGATDAANTRCVTSPHPRDGCIEAHSDGILSLDETLGCHCNSRGRHRTTSPCGRHVPHPLEPMCTVNPREVKKPGTNRHRKATTRKDSCTFVPVCM